MHAWENARDPALADLCKRIRRPAPPLKTFELFGEQAVGAGREEALRPGARGRLRCRGMGSGRVRRSRLPASDTPFGAEAEPLLVVFSKGPARPLSDVSFLLTRLAGQILSARPPRRCPRSCATMWFARSQPSPDEQGTR